MAAKGDGSAPSEPVSDPQDAATPVRDQAGLVRASLRSPGAWRTTTRTAAGNGGRDTTTTDGAGTVGGRPAGGSARLAASLPHPACPSVRTVPGPFVPCAASPSAEPLRHDPTPVATRSAPAGVTEPLTRRPLTPEAHIGASTDDAPWPPPRLDLERQV